jgi:heme-degrading monooxygenase HmoA
MAARRRRHLRRQTPLREDRKFIVQVVFEPGAEKAEANVEAVRGLLDDLVSQQPGFRRARLHKGVGQAEGVVVNYMEWESMEAFMAFRAEHADRVSAAIGQYGPRFLTSDVVHAVGDWG